MTEAFMTFSRVVDAINRAIGRSMAWLVLLAIVISATNATTRKLLHASSNAWLELQWVLFSAVFLLCASWTLQVNEHIRIDVLNNAFSSRWRNAIEVIGHLFFLLPLTVIMIITSYAFFMNSYEINEQSMNAGGLPQWPAKSLVLLGFTMLFFQGVSELIKRIAIIRGHSPDGPLSPAERDTSPSTAQLHTEKK